MNRPRRPALGPRSTAGRLGVRVVSLSLRPRGAITNTRVRAIGQQSRPIVLLGRHVMHARWRRVRVPRRPAANLPVPTRLDPAGRVQGYARVFRTSQRSAARLIVAGAARRQGPHRFRGLRRRSQTLAPLTARLVARPCWRASRSSASGQVEIISFIPNQSYAHLPQLRTQRRGSRLDDAALRARDACSLAMSLRH